MLKTIKCGLLVISFGFSIISCGTESVETQSENTGYTRPNGLPLNQNWDKDKRLVRLVGWNVPLPKSASIVSTSDISLKSVDGEIVQVKRVMYSPTSDFFFSQEFPDPYSSDKYISIRFKLKIISEYKVNDSVFFYSVAASKVSRENENTDLRSGPVIVFGFEDCDGDTHFETLQPDDSEILVPSWIATKSGKNDV